MALSRNNKSSKSDKSDKTFKRIENGSNGADSRAKNLDLALGQIEKQFGKGSIMKLGEAPRVSVDTIPTGSIGLDIALGIGGLPRGRIVEMFGPESSGKSTLSLHDVAQAQKQGGIAAFIDAEHALDVAYARNLGVNVDELLVSQPDTGEQGLEIADMLVRSGGVDLIVVDSVAALVPKAEIEGEMGDTHVGLQARLMSQALRKLAGNVSRSNTMIIFINQLREKIGVMFGCFSYETQVTLADGTQEQIGKIVSEKMPVEVLSYNFESGKVEPKKVINWFNNGGTDEFLHFTVLKPSKDGKAQFGATANHRIRTPGGWKEAKDLKVGERVLIATEQRLSEFQWEVIRGGLMGDSAVSQETPSYRMGHGAKPAGYLDWKVSLFGNIPMSRMTDEKGDNFVDLAPLAELADLGEEVYSQVREKNFSWNYLKRLSPLSLAIWYMNDGHLDIRSDWETSTRIRIPVQAMTPEARERVVSYLRDTWGLDVNLRNVKGKAMLVFDGVAAENFQELIAGYVHESMQDKLLPKYRERFNVTPVFKEMERGLEPSPIVDIHTKPLSGQQGRYDLEVEGSHNYFVDGVLVHNSPETTPGGRALKFYSSVRLDIRKIQNLKEGDEVVGSRVRVKVVKSKVSAPFRQTEFDIYYGMGVSKEGSLVDLAVDYAVMDKSGSWYMYDGDQIGQGRENAKAFLSEHPNIYSDIEKKVKEASGLLPIQLEEQAPSENGAEPVEAGKKD